MCPSRSAEALHGHINVPIAYKELNLLVLIWPAHFWDHMIRIGSLYIFAKRW